MYDYRSDQYLQMYTIFKFYVIQQSIILWFHSIYNLITVVIFLPIHQLANMLII